ncbi:hypothetical protein A1O7_07560 [Cladophialophora yegresii CBS 114405]|uniref:Uncharacterized protein n=1 Tax=Cladophialophora yegresii CBS 114405 TaxID=1182544 RepID=W9VNU1_9EURO|nr:uncharacterized protein A1O7_07560 [Cladophialophora yegresii CBS 114405]EXJ57213.1 hypothetical protein A1O7_07560 [Cladophialophora yegresii CBS 114405]
MLRRKPTALTITAEDITSFEESHARRLAYLRYKKTGDDPEGLFRNGAGPELLHQQNAPTESQAAGEQHQAQAAVVDPNDELKPLPGDKARIVRGREERIMGTGSNAR